MHDFGPSISGNTIVVDQYLNLAVIPLILAIVALLVHVVFAIAVFRDAAARRRARQMLWFVPPIIWGGATLIGSVFVAAVYWGMHYSSLAGSEPNR